MFNFVCEIVKKPIFSALQPLLHFGGGGGGIPRFFACNGHLNTLLNPTNICCFVLFVRYGFFCDMERFFINQFIN
jgi:hypothetical protein